MMGSGVRVTQAAPVFLDPLNCALKPGLSSCGDTALCNMAGSEPLDRAAQTIDDNFADGCAGEAAASDITKTAIFDPAPLNELQSVLNTGQVSALAVSYGETVQTALTNLDRAAAEDDLAALGEYGHDLKSNAGSFGACRLQHLAGLLEQFAHDGKHGAAVALLPAIHAAAEAADGEIRAHLAKK